MAILPNRQIGARNFVDFANKYCVNSTVRWGLRRFCRRMETVSAYMSRLSCAICAAARYDDDGPEAATWLSLE